MARVDIKSIEVDEKGTLGVYPAEPLNQVYENVYRAAQGVYWNSEDQCFSMKSVKAWGPRQVFQNIIDAVDSELGIQLVFQKSTRWVGIDENAVKQTE